MKKITSYLFALILVLTGYGLLLLWGMTFAWRIVLLLILLALAGWLFASALGRVLPRINIIAWICAGLLILAGLLFPTSLLMSGHFPSLANTVLFWMPPLAILIAAMLLYSGLNLYSMRKDPLMEEDSRRQGRFAILAIALSILLLVRVIYNLYDLTLWDNTYDPLEYIWLIVPILAAFISGVILFSALPDRMKITGILYPVLIPLLMILVSARAQNVDFRQETAGRAERIVQAISSYYERKGRYPEMLSKLSPWYILSVPHPMIIAGQDWCYESGEDYYRLGYLDREHWSDPRLIGRIYKTVGAAPDATPMCMQEFTAIQNGQPGYPYTYLMESE